MEALQESTTMLQVAGKLLDQGNLEEARRLRDKARARRNVSVWLMAKANTSEDEPERVPGGVRGFRQFNVPLIIRRRELVKSICRPRW